MPSVVTLKPATCGHFKTGHFGWRETLIVLPCFCVRLQGTGCVVEAVLDIEVILMRVKLGLASLGSRLAE